MSRLARGLRGGATYQPVYVEEMCNAGQVINPRGGRGAIENRFPRPPSSGTSRVAPGGTGEPCSSVFAKQGPRNRVSTAQFEIGGFSWDPVSGEREGNTKARGVAQRTRQRETVSQNHACSGVSPRQRRYGEGPLPWDRAPGTADGKYGNG